MKLNSTKNEVSGFLRSKISTRVDKLGNRMLLSKAYRINQFVWALTSINVNRVCKQEVLLGVSNDIKEP